MLHSPHTVEPDSHRQRRESDRHRRTASSSQTPAAREPRTHNIQPYTYGIHPHYSIDPYYRVLRNTLTRFIEGSLFKDLNNTFRNIACSTRYIQPRILGTKKSAKWAFTCNVFVPISHYFAYSLSLFHSCIYFAVPFPIHHIQKKHNINPTDLLVCWSVLGRGPSVWSKGHCSSGRRRSISTPRPGGVT